jgi:hypothetical protein
MYTSTTPAQIHTLTSKSQPSSRLSSSAIAYMEMPEENTVIAAKEMAFRPRVFSSNRNFRYSGTERTREP